MGFILTNPTCRVRKFMSLIGLLTATEKTGTPGQTSYETHSLAHQKALESPRTSPRFLYPYLHLLCQTWHRPQVDMFATRYNYKLVQYMSPVPDPNAWAMDALTVSCENLDMYAFPPVPLLGKVVSKLSDLLYKRVILIALGWPNLPWFWDLVELSFQIPFAYPIIPT